ncbi:MAG TPA: molecular chaperone HtpG [Holophaga sp.]|nr:molecular chaperone HtpG [Holophaga sp.]HPS67325.1 molecular chaperone HtpG [Holophaga sp.]
MTDSTIEKREFKSELRQMLSLITHSLYSHKEIFLRELISNASDAIDKIRFNSLQNETLLEGDRDWKIKLTADKAAGTLTVSDNGVGMSRDAVIDNLGTIARSGTREFLDSLQRSETASRPELIGQFGVGFYSAFMVADKVTVVSRAAGEAQAVRWVSDGQGEFTVERVARAGRGTDVILHLKEEEKEFLEAWRLRAVVKQFSDFIEHPVVMDVEREDEKGGKAFAEETLNSRKALWLRSKSDVTPEEHAAFYHQISGDVDDPAKVIHYAAEGTLEFKALLYIPKRRSFELQFGEGKVGPKLYINRVQIMDHCEQLLPSYLRFVKGVVDCSDLPLNVSREILQHNPLLEKIQKSLVKNIFQALADFKTADYDAYVEFSRELGGILKEGLGRDWANREAIADLLLFESLKTEKGKYLSLAQYVEAMPADQTGIYFMTGEDRAALDHSPALEAFRHRGWDVLFLTEPIDEFVFPMLPDYKGKPLKAADRNAPELPEEDRKKAEEVETSFKPLLALLSEKLTGLKEVRLSRRLKESAACLVADEGALGANMERLMQKLGRAEGGPSPRILELNPDHPAVRGLLKLHAADPADPRIESHARLLHDQAVLTEGSRLADPSDFVRRLNELLAKDA